MTQKEYKEEIEKYKQEIFNLQEELRIEKNKSFNYLEVLQTNYELNKDLQSEKEDNRRNCASIMELNKIIEKYEKILDKFTINY